MMYLFPRQFGLHNVFTSKVDFTETAQKLNDYTLREQEIQAKFGQLGGDNSRVPTRLPPRLRGEAQDLTRKMQIQHSRCSYSQLLQHYCPVCPSPALLDFILSKNRPLRESNPRNPYRVAVVRPLDVLGAPGSNLPSRFLMQDRRDLVKACPSLTSRVRCRTFRHSASLWSLTSSRIGSGAMAVSCNTTRSMYYTRSISSFA